MMSKPKLKILCLHGYRQNGDVFRMKTGSLRKMLKNYADFYYATAPHLIPQPTGLEAFNEECLTDQHGWWFTSEQKTYNSKEYSQVSIGFEESLQYVETVLREQGPFDGVLGFSQGASFLSLLCALQQQGLKNNFDFAIFFAGFKSRCEPHQNYYKEMIAVPSLHVFGETDEIIPKDMSEDLLKAFSSPSIVLHRGGHYVPASGPQKESYIKFLEKFQKKM